MPAVVRLSGLCALAACVMAHVAQPSLAEERSGRELYAAKCARCHGSQGEGTADYPDRLEGDLSVAQLDLLIAKTMPEDDPESLTAMESQTVAKFIHGEFYSSAARQRNRPVRIELARLTVRQYRQAVSDLIGSFRPPATLPAERGLQGEYYRGRRVGNRRERVASRVDAQVAFDFGTEAPVEEIKEPHQFSIRWDGSLLAAETGEYEFVVRTEHAARLWINDREHPAIDAWVKSGDDTEFRTSLFLLEGRAYPLRLEFTKAKQGVDDSKKQKKKPPSAPASITLLWKRPQNVLQPIPRRHLIPQMLPESYVCATRFPPDDRSYGWVRGTSVSKAWDQATTEAAIETAGYVIQHLDGLAGTKNGAADRAEKLRTFCRTFVERAFRQPLSDEEAVRFVDRQFSAAENDLETAVKRVVLLSLKSPRFLFREVDRRQPRGAADSYHVAARLSFGLWDSIPDATLRQAAAANQLGNPAQIARQAERMLEDPRAQSKLRSFLLTWLRAANYEPINKDGESFPDFDADTVSDLRTSLEMFLDEVLASEGADYRRLLTADEVYLNDRLAKVYRQEPAEGEQFAKVRLDDGKRAGVLTHPYLLAKFSHLEETSPIHRGVFLAKDVLGKTLRPPPDFFAPLSAELHPDLTTRQRVSLQTKPASCASCHTMINSLGFTLEHFDAIGRYREKDRDQPIDDSGSYIDRDGKRVPLEGAQGLAQFLARSPETHDAFVERMFHHLVQQPVLAYGPTVQADLRRAFEDADFNIRRLAIQIMVATAATGRDTEVAVSLTE